MVPGCAEAGLTSPTRITHTVARRSATWAAPNRRGAGRVIGLPRGQRPLCLCVFGFWSLCVGLCWCVCVCVCVGGREGGKEVGMMGLWDEKVYLSHCLVAAPKKRPVYA
jgi:hypothetical protein